MVVSISWQVHLGYFFLLICVLLPFLIRSPYGCIFSQWKWSKSNFKPKLSLRLNFLPILHNFRQSLQKMSIFSTFHIRRSWYSHVRRFHVNWNGTTDYSIKKYLIKMKEILHIWSKSWFIFRLRNASCQTAHKVQTCANSKHVVKMQAIKADT